MLLWTESGYFDSASELKPLPHLWSLGVEEPFYIVWPLPLYAIVRLKLRPWLGMLGCAAVSFACNLFEVAGNPSGAFYLPLPRPSDCVARTLLVPLILRLMPPER